MASDGLVRKHWLAGNVQLRLQNAAAAGFRDEEGLSLGAAERDISRVQIRAAPHAIDWLSQAIDHPDRPHSDVGDGEAALRIQSQPVRTAPAARHLDEHAHLCRAAVTRQRYAPDA